MLVLQRHVNQEIHIGDDIRIVVTKIQGDKVWLGISAPKDVAVHRGEVYAAIKAGDAGPVRPGQPRAAR